MIELNFEEVKRLLIDPWNFLVVEVLSGEFYICRFCNGEPEILEQVILDDHASEKLDELSEENVIVYDSIHNYESMSSLSNMLPWAHFYDIFRKYGYGVQPSDAYEKAKLLGLNITKCEYKQEFVKVLEDGRVQAKITCENEWLGEAVSVITNDDRIGITPLPMGHVAKVVAQKENGDNVTLYGFFPESTTTQPLRESDENLYFNGICLTLTSGPTNELFGGYK